MAVTVGSAAPDFTLPNQDRESVTLSQQVAKGPVVLAFFPAAFSSVCTTELCTFRDGMAAFGRVGATVLGISVDTFFTLKAYADAQKLPFPLLSDFNKTVIREYGVYNEDMIGLKGIAKEEADEHGRNRSEHDRDDEPLVDRVTTTATEREDHDEGHAGEAKHIGAQRYEYCGEGAKVEDRAEGE